MTLRDPGVHLEDIEHDAEAAMRFAAGFDLAAYLADDKTRAAVERALESCAEAMRQLDRIAPGVARSIPHARAIIGFRDILAHGCAGLDHTKVFAVVTADAPELLRAARAALKAFPDPGPPD